MSVQHVRAARARKQAEERAKRVASCRKWDHHLHTMVARMRKEDDKQYCFYCGDLLFVPALDGLRQDIHDRQLDTDNFIRAVIRRKPWYKRLWYRWKGLL